VQLEHFSFAGLGAVVVGEIIVGLLIVGLMWWLGK